MKTIYRSLALTGCSALLVTTAMPALGQSTAEMLKTAEQACIEKAAAEGYDPTRAEVISSESVDADTVKVVLNLTKDGNNFARLTCPYSASRGVVSFGDAVTAPNNWNWLWWLLLPLIGIPLLLWLLRGRDQREYVAADRIRREPTRDYVSADRVQGRTYTDAYVNTGGERLDVKEYPNQTAKVLRRLDHGEHLELTGQQDKGWVELLGGGWVESRFLRFSDTPKTYS